MKGPRAELTRTIEGAPVPPKAPASVSTTARAAARRAPVRETPRPEGGARETSIGVGGSPSAHHRDGVPLRREEAHDLAPDPAGTADDHAVHGPGWVLDGGAA